MRLFYGLQSLQGRNPAAMASARFVNVSRLPISGKLEHSDV